MEKINQIVKQVLIFTIIFLGVNYVFSFFVSDQNLISSAGNIVFETSKNEFKKSQMVGVEISNTTDKPLTIENECPNEPFNVFRFENNEWVQKNSSPDLDCSNAKDLTIQPGEEINILYENWNNSLFSELGRYKIEFTSEINGEEKTIPSNEFIVKDDGLLRKLINGLFYRPIYNALIFLITILPGYDLGFAIIILTIIIRTILLAPSHKSLKAQKKMQEIQPRLNKIKEKYKNDKQKQALETMAVWKESGVSPTSSCLPLLLQFPFLIAFFYVVKGGLNPDNYHLLYTEFPNFSFDLINVNFLGILDLTTPNLYVLPLIIGGLQFTQLKMTMSRNKKKSKKKEKENEMMKANQTMMYIMPVLIAVFTASVPAGVGLYWGTSTIYAIVQQAIINRSKPESEPKVRVINSD